MDLQTLKKVSQAVIDQFPDSKNPEQFGSDVSVILDQTEHYSFSLETEVRSKTECFASFVYAFPPFELEVDGYAERQLRKANKKFFNPRGFSLEVVKFDGGFWGTLLIYELQGSEGSKDIEKIYEEFLMLAIFAFRTVSKFV
jgi:hypothetical protein